MNSVSDLIKKIQQSKLTEIGAVYLFGSFVRTEGEKYNDIDLFVEAEPDQIENVRKILSGFSHNLIVGPKYLPNKPFPTPKPPFPKYQDGFRNNDDVLHVTVCSREQAMSQSFFGTMVSGKHIIIERSSITLH